MELIERPIEPMTLTTAAAALRSGRRTPRDLLEDCLARIDRYEPSVQAWASIDRVAARRQADQLTIELHAGRDRGLLHGIPVGIKDIIDVRDMPTACGNPRWASAIAREDAVVVRRLRDAGAIIIGKTVTTPFAFLDPPITRNPWNLTRTPGGSSSGSAAAVACGMCLAALGSQTGGSLTRPASFCGVASIKPRHGAVPLTGVLPLAPSFDHLGILARTVTDAAGVLEAITTGATASPLNAVPGNSSSGGTPTGATPDTYGTTRKCWRFMPWLGYFRERAEPVMNAMLDLVHHRIADASGQQGDNLAEPMIQAEPPLNLPEIIPEILQHHRTILAAEAAHYHTPRLDAYSADYPPKIWQLIVDGQAVSEASYQAAQAARRAHQQFLNEQIPPDAVILTPAAVGPAPDPSTTGDASLNSPWSYLGWPTVSLPVTRTADGLPLAVQLASRPDREADLLAAATWLESVLGWPLDWPPVP